jgi:two-component system, probable response regulator PhcQ
MSRIMIVDDEESILKALKRLSCGPRRAFFGNKTYNLEVETFSSSVAALEHARTEAFDLFISDYRMPELDGVEFLKAVKQIQPDSARLILSGYADLNALVRAVNEVGIDRFIGKPWNDYDLMSAIAQALAHRELVRKTANWPIWCGWKWATRRRSRSRPNASSAWSRALPKSIGDRTVPSFWTRICWRKIEAWPNWKTTG